MIAYKGFKRDLTCTMGKGVFQYHEGLTVREESSKCARSGLHCTENPLDCLHYYSLGQGNRYFKVEAAGDINEDGTDTRISCTEMTLLQELTVKQLAGYGMMYIIQYPKRDWQQDFTMVQVKPDKAEANCAGAIAIARGAAPKVKGVKGAVLGLIKEEADGFFCAAKVFEVDGKIRPGIWYTLENGELREVSDEE